MFVRLCQQKSNKFSHYTAVKPYAICASNCDCLAAKQGLGIHLSVTSACCAGTDFSGRPKTQLCVLISRLSHVSSILGRVA